MIYILNVFYIMIYVTFVCSSRWKSSGCLDSNLKKLTVGIIVTVSVARTTDDSQM